MLTGDLCSPLVCRERGEEEVVTDPLELLGKRIDFQIHLDRCLGVKWLKEDAKRGIQMGYWPVHMPPTAWPWGAGAFLQVLKPSAS